MAKNEETEVRTSIDNLNDSLSGIEQKVQNNQKIIMWVCIAVAAIVVCVLIYIYGVRNPGKQAANEAIGQADIQMAMGNDSIALAQYKQVADEYGYEAGNRANLNAAILLYQQGKYEEAINYLENYSATESVIGASSKALEGDCYVNLDKYDEALSCFREAIKISDNNPAYTPYFMMKEATVLREMKEYKEEAAVYQQIIDKYPTYGLANQIDFQKYLKRAQVQAGEE